MATMEGKPEQRGFVVILPAELHREFKFAALEEDRTLGSLVREFIAEYVEKRKEPAQPAVK